ncbi:MAG: hypothetical protein ACOYU2_01985 [Nitrospirota bacterium]|jgi:hypothetical protein
METNNEDVNMGSLLIETGTTIASLILFPVLAQSLKIPPALVHALRVIKARRNELRVETTK